MLSFASLRVVVDMLHPVLSLLWSLPIGVVAATICGSIPSMLLVEGCCRKGCGSGFGAKVKTFAYLQADDSDALGRPLPRP